MSTNLLFGAGAIVTFITLWGVLMATGLSATRHQTLNDEDHTPTVAPIPVTGPVVHKAKATSSPVPPPRFEG